MAVNKQPIFTGTPVLQATRINSGGTVFDISDIRNSSTSVFVAGIGEGTLIDRITITAFASPDSSYRNVSDKLIYLSAYDGSTDSAIIRVINFPATTVSNTTLPPSEVITLEGGIVLPNSYELMVGQTVVAGNGDGLYVLVEGGTYSAV